MQFAVAPGDISFLDREKQKHNVRYVGAEREEDKGLIIRVLTARDGGAKRWTVWYSQPLPEARSPQRLLADAAPGGLARYTHGTYVALKVNPKPALRREVTRCVDFDSPQSTE